MFTRQKCKLSKFANDSKKLLPHGIKGTQGIKGILGIQGIQRKLGVQGRQGKQVI